MVILKKINVFFLIMLIVGAITTSIHAFDQTNKEIDPQKIDSYLTNTIANNHIPGLSIAVVQNDKVVFQKGYGQIGLGRPVTPQTQFFIGSISKSFTALAVMQLVEQGRLDLDTPVQRYLPWFEIADKEIGKRITVRNLLNQTSGLSESGDPGVNKYSPTLKEQIEGMKIARLTAQVGQKYQYDSQNYRILALLIEQVSGQTFAEYIKNNIFIPLGMNNSTADPIEMNNLIQGYGQIFGFPIAREEKFQPAGVGSGYIVSTAEDMSILITVMLNRGQFGNRKLISEKSWVEMMTPPEGVESEYGMGWIITSMNDEKTIFHGGSLRNYHAFAMMLPENNTGFVFLSNQNGIIPMYTFFNALKKDLAKYLTDNILPSGISFEWIYWFLILFALSTIGFQIYRIARIPKRMQNAVGKKPWRRWLNVLLNVLIPSIFLFMPFFAKTFLGASSASWKDAFSMIPDVVLWLIVIVFLNISIGLIKLSIIHKNRYRKVQ